MGFFMDIHPTWIIITGLALDIIGAVFIVGPLLTLVKRTWGDINPEKEKVKSDMLGMFWDDQRIQKFAWIGIVLLSVGFTMQIIGNYYQDPPN